MFGKFEVQSWKTKILVMTLIFARPFVVGELGLGLLGSLKVHFSVLKYRHMLQRFGIYS